MVAAEDYFKNIEAVHSGNLEVRLAENNQEIDAAQALSCLLYTSDAADE